MKIFKRQAKQREMDNKTIILNKEQQLMAQYTANEFSYIDYNLSTKSTSYTTLKKFVFKKSMSKLLLSLCAYRSGSDNYGDIQFYKNGVAINVKILTGGDTSQSSESQLYYHNSSKSIKVHHYQYNSIGIKLLLPSFEVGDVLEIKAKVYKSRYSVVITALLLQNIPMRVYDNNYFFEVLE